MTEEANKQGKIHKDPKRHKRERFRTNHSQIEGIHARENQEIICGVGYCYFSPCIVICRGFFY